MPSLAEPTPVGSALLSVGRASILYRPLRFVSNAVKCVYSLGLVSEAQFPAAAAPGVPALVLLFNQYSSHEIEYNIINDLSQIHSEIISASLGTIFLEFPRKCLHLEPCQ